MTPVWYDGTRRTKKPLAHEAHRDTSWVQHTVILQASRPPSNPARDSPSSVSCAHPAPASPAAPAASGCSAAALPIPARPSVVRTANSEHPHRRPISACDSAPSAASSRIRVDLRRQLRRAFRAPLACQPVPGVRLAPPPECRRIGPERRRDVLLIRPGQVGQLHRSQLAPRPVPGSPPVRRHPAPHRSRARSAQRPRAATAAAAIDLSGISIRPD